MTTTRRGYWAGGIWRRLFVVIGATVMVLWFMLALSILLFARVQEDYSDLAASHVPRLALSSELAEYSARLAGLATAILGRQTEDQDLLAEIKRVSVQLSSALQDPAWTDPLPANAPDVRRIAETPGDVEGELLTLLALFENRRALSDALADRIERLRWLNVDIQDEVDPILNDYTFNIEAMMRAIGAADERSVREDLVRRIGDERTLRNTIAQIGGDAATAVTLIIQGSVAADPLQLERFSDLTNDMLVRVAETVDTIPSKPEFLTLRQSVAGLREVAQGEKGVFALRKDWLTQELRVYARIQSLQDGITALQANLTEVAESEKRSVLASVDGAAQRLRTTMAWLIGATILVGIAGVAALFGIVQKGIIAPLQQLTDAMMGIAEGERTGALPPVTGDEIGRMAQAVGAFQSSIRARDEAIDDLHRTQAELVQAGKMAALGNLSAGISHELNQPLAAMKYRLHLLRSARDTHDASQVDRQIGRISALAERMEAIIAHLRRFARRADQERVPLSLGEAIDNAIALMRGKIDAPGITLKVQDASRAASVVGDPILVEQVLVNLLSNAVDAIEDAGGTGEIEIAGARAGQDFVLTISDTGIGLGDLAPEVAIDPFVSTKSAGRGMGLGLSISYNIARDLNGDFRLEPGEKGGARAVLQLPSGDSDD